MENWRRDLQESRSVSSYRDKNIYDPQISLLDLKKCDLCPVIFRSKRFFLWFISIEVREEKLKIYLSLPNCSFPSPKHIILLSCLFSLVYYTLWYRAMYSFAASTFFLVFHFFDSFLTESTSGFWTSVGRLFCNRLKCIGCFCFKTNSSMHSEYSVVILLWELVIWKYWYFSTVNHVNLSVTVCPFAHPTDIKVKIPCSSGSCAGEHC